MSAITESKARFNEVVSKIFSGFGEAFRAFGSFINDVGDTDGESYDEINKGNGGLVATAVIKALMLEEEARGKLEKKYSGIKKEDEKNDECNENAKNENVYKEIENKFKNRMTSVSGEVDKNAKNEQRPKGGIQRVN